MQDKLENGHFSTRRFLWENINYENLSMFFWILEFGNFTVIFMLVVMGDYLFSRILSSRASSYLRESFQVNVNTVM